MTEISQPGGGRGGAKSNKSHCTDLGTLVRKCMNWITFEGVIVRLLRESWPRGLESNFHIKARDLHILQVSVTYLGKLSSLAFHCPHALIRICPVNYLLIWALVSTTVMIGKWLLSCRLSTALVPEPCSLSLCPSAKETEAVPGATPFTQSVSQSVSQSITNMHFLIDQSHFLFLAFNSYSICHTRQGWWWWSGGG